LIEAEVTNFQRKMQGWHEHKRVEIPEEARRKKTAATVEIEWLVET
jgi:hypothetical protein